MHVHSSWSDGDLTIGHANNPGFTFQCDGTLIFARNMLEANDASFASGTVGNWQAKDGNTQLTYDNSRGYHAIKTVMAAAGDNYAHIPHSYWLHIIPGETYTFAADLDIPAALTGGAAYLRVAQYNRLMAVLTGSTVSSTTLTSTSGKQRLTVTFTATEGSIIDGEGIWLNLQLVNAGAGTVYWSDIMWERSWRT